MTDDTTDYMNGEMTYGMTNEITDYMTKYMNENMTDYQAK